MIEAEKSIPRSIKPNEIGLAGYRIRNITIAPPEGNPPLGATHRFNPLISSKSVNASPSLPKGGGINYHLRRAMGHGDALP